MPAQVQRPPQPPPTNNENHGHPHHSHADPVHWSNQHREALRLALGTILTPKRPTQSRSSSSSGTASPSMSSGLSSPALNPHPQPPHMTHSHSAPEINGFLHPHHHSHHSHSHSHMHHHPHLHQHIPSRLGLSTSDSSQDIPSLPPPLIPIPHEPPDPISRSVSSQSNVSATTNPSSPTSEHAEIPALHPVLPPPALPTPSGSTQTSSSGPSSSPPSPPSGSGTPKAKFIETLQGKSAWDALIHGSFS